MRWRARTIARTHARTRARAVCAQASVLAVFLRLAELVNAPVSVILISKIVWEKFRGGTGASLPAQPIRLLAHS